MTLRFFGSQNIPQRNTLFKFSRKVSSQIRILQTPGEICVIFVADNEIKRLNRLFLNRSGATDVIAFNYQKFKKNTENTLPFGDIFISVETALQQSRNGKHSLVQELALLILHGLLHLAGYEDHTPARRNRMFGMQRKIFRKVNLLLAPPDFR